MVPETLPDPQNLSKSEQIALDHYRKKPEGRGFLAVAEIFVRKQQIEEAIQLLSAGLERHPTYSVARVYLTQLFMRRFFFQEAWTTLESSPTPLRGNLTAQILRLKLCILLGFEPQALALVKELSSQDYQDPETRVIIEHMELQSFAQVRRNYADYLKVPAGILPRESVPTEGGLPPIPRQSPGEGFLKAATQDAAMDDAGFRDRVTRGFFASPVTEIFAKPLRAPHPDQAGLDELTRARLLRRQGLYQNAFELYKRLAHSAPGNELIRREFAEIRELRDIQQEIDQQIDPNLAQSMDKVRGLDQKIKFLNELLSCLDGVHEVSP